MKVRILGCGPSSGVPRIGNDWGDCDPSEPRNRRSRCSILIDSDGERLLVDCGPDLRGQLLAADVATLDRVIVTHDHADHCHGIDDLRQVAHNIARCVPLHARADVLERLRRRFPYPFEGSTLYPAVLEPTAIEGEMIHGSARLRFADQPHGGVASLGIRADEATHSMVYSIDFHELNADMAILYERVDLWISDCFPRPHPTHAHLDAVLRWARELGVGQLLLTHLDKSLDYATLAARLPDWVAPAYDGLEIVL